MLTALLPQAARLAALPAAANPCAAVLIPVLAYVVTRRNLKFKLSIS